MNNAVLQTFSLDSAPISRDLSGVLDDKQFHETLWSDIRAMRERNSPLSVLMIGIDHFASYNEAYGREAGDACARAISDSLLTTLGRFPATLYHLGAEQFATILPGADRARANDLAERLRFIVASANCVHSASPLGRVTVCIGVATLHPHEVVNPHSRELLLQVADVRFGRARAHGHNRVAGN